MLDDLFASDGSSVDPATLELSAHKAARLFLDRGVPPTRAVQKVAEDHPEYNENHLRRVVEKTNNLIFTELHERGMDKNVHFPVADPEKVIGEKTASPTRQARPTIDDYAITPKAHFAPAQEKVAADEGPELYQGEHADPRLDVYEEQIQLEGALDTLRGERVGREADFANARSRLTKLARTEILTSGLGPVVSLFSKIASVEEAEALLAPVIEELVTTASVSPESMQASIEKTAGSVVNPEHPLVVTYGQLSKAAEDLCVVEEAIAETEAALAAARGFLKEAILGAAANVAARGALRTAGAVGKATLSGGPVAAAGKALTLASAPEAFIRNPIRAGRAAAGGTHPDIQRALAEAL